MDCSSPFPVGGLFIVSYAGKLNIRLGSNGDQFADGQLFADCYTQALQRCAEEFGCGGESMF